jgi:hypothetical protein
MGTVTKVKAEVSGTQKLEARYANYFQIGHNCCEFLLDFGQQYDGDEQAALHTRIITGPAYAKELLETLKEAVRAYEEEFGAIGRVE